MVNSGGVVAEVAKESGGPMNQNLKKGPWTAAEDAILMEYVKKHGEGNWNAVQKNSGLMRCGKSCRLRWANHLRPNLKKGSFSPEEERIIIELHAKLGNKWARMAAQLPGRTDNEIKNYWNTRMKRRQRAGLPIYPQEVQEKAAAFHLQQVHHHHHHHKRPHNNSSSSSLPSLLTSQNPTYNPSLSLFNSYNFTSPPNHPLQNQANSYYANPNHQFKLFCNNNNTNSNINTTGFSLPLSSSPTPYPPSSAGLFNQNIQTQAVPFPTFKFDHGNLERDLSFSSMIAGASIDPIDFVPGQETEFPASQTPPQPTTPSSGSSGGVCVMVGSGNTTNNNNIDYKTAPPKTASTISNSGLLDALVQESHHLARNDLNLNSENNFSVAAAAEEAAADKGKGVVDYVSSEEGGVESMIKHGGDANADNQWDDLSSSQSSIGIKRSGEPLEEMNSMDEDLMSLLNNFPMAMPLPEWYPAGSSNISNASSSSITAGSNVESADQPNVPPTSPPPPPQPAVSSPEIQWTQLSSYSSWNNMPGIC